MEKQLKCFLLLSLKEIALRRVAVLFWSGSDILASLWKAELTNLSHEEWREAIEDKIKNKMLKLELPNSLTKQMIDLVRPISLEVTAWKKAHRPFLLALRKGIAFPDSTKLCWTTSGAINYKRTAEELVRCDRFDVRQRYELSCEYCLEDSISLNWEELPQDLKWMYFYDSHLLPYLPYCWPYILKREPSELDFLARYSDKNMTTFYQFAFENSAESCRKSAAEYFFQKLTQEEREASLMRTAHAVIVDRDVGSFAKEKRSDLLCYLLSVMTPEQQMEIIKSHPIDVFLCFLCWPLQDLFSENAGIFWTFLPPDRYITLSQKITSGYEFSFLYLPKMFKEFFMESPRDFKKWFVDEDSTCESPACRFLYEFFVSEDSESIKVMFRNLDAADRVKLVFQHRVFALIYFGACWWDRWHMVEVCLREATLSKEQKKRLNEAITALLERSPKEKLVNQKFELFLL